MTADAPAPSTPVTLARILRAGIATWMMLLIVAAPAIVAGCAEPVAHPDLTLPQTAGDDLEGDADPGVDVRTIDERGAAPDGPVTPSGAEAPASDDSARLAEPGQNPEIFANAQPAQGVARSNTTGAAETTESAGYYTVGGVLAEVNGKPIFTDEVISAVANELRGLARQQGDREAFVRQAAGVLGRELNARIYDETLRLVAERNLTRADRERAGFAATQYRINRITAAGGSEARARQYAREETGLSLEKLVEDREKEFLFQLFLQAVVLPRAIPSADDVRAYFLRHRDAMLKSGGQGKIEFLLIEFDTTSDAPEQVQARAQHVRQLALAGEDFAKLAAEYNDNAAYQASGGTIPGMPLGRGDFRWPAVDQAVWATPAGGVTEVISDDAGRRLFLAKVISKEEPKPVSFDEAQRQIRDIITNQRRIELIRQYMDEARGYAAVTPGEEINRNLQTAVEVVAQQYEAWRAE